MKYHLTARQLFAMAEALFELWRQKGGTDGDDLAGAAAYMLGDDMLQAIGTMAERRHVDIEAPRAFETRMRISPFVGAVRDAVAASSGCEWEQDARSAAQAIYDQAGLLPPGFSRCP